MSRPASAAWPTPARRLPALTGGRNGGAGPPNRTLDFRESCRRAKLPQAGRCWDLSAAERNRRGETDIPSSQAYNPFRHRQQGPYA